ncbi:enoyl-CoA delta isomerase 1, mitochondrial [Caerostris extrusa]|uniref:Enoyl-CoA delta isomerase 1, mitochondrial n=1 Tax=Caerostris extrusa TaxID=172846 RepID=A0AAV4PGS5_CAEEX|nr:enoyl-CoA delta isomerase 1, mitochondrial [Caerostris extrusa]
MVKSKGSIGFPENRLGFAAPKWLRMLLLNATTVRNCEYALKSDKLLTPEEALKYNMIDDLVDSSSDLIPKAEEVMDMWLKVPDAAFRIPK